MSILKINKDDSLSDSTLKIAVRILVTIVLVFIAFILIMASNMGPAYAPNIWNGKLDIIIRLGCLAVGLCLAVAAITWLLWPLLAYVVKQLKRVKHN